MARTKCSRRAYYCGWSVRSPFPFSYQGQPTMSNVVERRTLSAAAGPRVASTKTSSQRSSCTVGSESVAQNRYDSYGCSSLAAADTLSSYAPCPAERCRAPHAQRDRKPSSCKHADMLAALSCTRPSECRHSHGGCDRRSPSCGRRQRRHTQARALPCRASSSAARAEQQALVVVGGAVAAHAGTRIAMPRVAERCTRSTASLGGDGWSCGRGTTRSRTIPG